MLDALFHPASIAVVGASRDEKKVGHAVLSNLIKYRYPGRLFPINPSGAEILGLDPTFPLKYMIYFLIVVAVGGTSSVTGPLCAAILLGIWDVAGKYYIPKLGAFIVYCLMIAILIWRPQGLFSRAGGK